jgi:hypothetical protein
MKKRTERKSMNAYAIALFVHIVGALVFFASLALEWAGLRQVRRAVAPEGAGAWMRLLSSARPISIASMLTLVISGGYMMATTWGASPWMLVTLGSLAVVIALSLVLTGPGMAAIGRALAVGRGMLVPTFHRAANNPLLTISLHTRVALTLGIVLLKVIKPDWGGSLLIISVAIVLGLFPTLATWGRAAVRATLAS